MENTWLEGYPEVAEGKQSELVEVQYTDGDTGKGVFVNGWDRSKWLTSIDGGSGYEQTLLNRGWGGKIVKAWRPIMSQD